MKILNGNIGAQRIELNEYQPDAEMRKDMATQFTAALLSCADCEMGKTELVKFAIECADELIKKLKEK